MVILLVAVVLSAQSTDKKVNELTKQLFKIATSAEEMYKTFVQHKNLNEKYPENMMRAMGYFEVFYNHKLKEEKKAIEDYQNNYPNVKKSSKKAIQSLYSLSQAKKDCYRWGLNSDIERGNWDCKLNKSTMEYLLIKEYSDDGIYDPKVINKFK